jgi:GNAT superfamily N-acetyltransferase
MRIEAASEQTLDAVLALLGAQFAEHAIDLPGSTLRDAVRGTLGDPRRGAIFLAYDPGPIGVAVVAYTWTLEHGGLVAWLEELFVVPARRGRGLGGQLLEHVLGFARQAGCHAVELEVDAGHARAEHLYGRAGFTSLPRRRCTKRLSAGAAAGE